MTPQVDSLRVRGIVFRPQVEVLESRCLMSTYAHLDPGGPVNLHETVPVNIVFISYTPTSKGMLAQAWPHNALGQVFSDSSTGLVPDFALMGGQARTTIQPRSKNEKPDTADGHSARPPRCRPSMIRGAPS